MTSLIKLRFDAKYLPSTLTLIVRWYPTKPRWVPTAKTKKFRVIPRPQELFPGEKAECNRLYQNYKSHLKGALTLLRSMYRESEVSQDVIDAQEKEKEDFWKESIIINDEWNRRIAIEREQRDRESFKEEVRKAKEKMQQVDEANRREQERIDGLIREQEELSKTIISPDQLDEHVEKILNSKPYSFNYALDLQGNVYDDFSSTPTRKVTEDGKFESLLPDEGTKPTVIRKKSR